MTTTWQGAALWPAWYPIERLEQIRNVLPARDWNALYQQDPIPDERDYFKLAWFADYEALPEQLNVYGASDYAVTEAGGDFTEHGVVGVDANSNIYVIDWWREKAAANVWVESQCDLIVKDRHRGRSQPFACARRARLVVDEPVNPAAFVAGA